MKRFARATVYTKTQLQRDIRASIVRVFLSLQRRDTLCLYLFIIIFYLIFLHNKNCSLLYCNALFLKLIDNKEEKTTINKY